MTSITITLPIPHPKLSPNARVHWAQKAKLVKSHRDNAAYRSIAAIKGREYPFWTKARVSVVAYFKTAAHRDADNIMASMKAYFDGIADAGIVDNDRAFSHEPLKIEKDAQNPRVEITITPITGDQTEQMIASLLSIEGLTPETRRLIELAR